MKKLILLACGVIFAAATSSAQLTVNKTGQTIFGKPAVISPFNPPVITPPLQKVTNIDGGTIVLNYVKTDSLATAVFLGKGTENRGGYITFGGGKRVWVGESSDYDSNYGLMELGFAQGIRGVTRGGTLFSGKGMSTFRFYTDLRANSFIVDSDSRIKSNVESLDNSSRLLSSLSPISYTLTSQSVAGRDNGMSVKSESGMSGDAAPVAPDGRTRFGFMAQEVKDIFPELVVEEEDGTLGIDYIGFIPVLVDAVKSLSREVEEQRQVIASLGGAPNLRPGTAAVDTPLSQAVTLSQNMPNPFSGSSEITCSIPEGVSDASLMVYDLQGKQVASIPVAGRGESVVTVHAGDLAPGMYIYLLLTDGIESESRRLIVRE